MGQKHSTRIMELLNRNPHAWLNSNEISKAIPDIPKNSVYGTVSYMVLTEKSIVRRDRPGAAGYEYQTPANAKKGITLTDQTGPGPIVEAVKPVPSAGASAPVGVVSQPQQKPKYVPPPTTTMRDTLKDAIKDAYKDLEWTDAEKLMVASQYVRIRKLRTWLNPNEVLREAQKVLPVSRQYKLTIDRTQFPWLDDYIQKSVMEANKPKQIIASVAEERDSEFRQKMASQAVVSYKTPKTIEHPEIPSKPIITHPEPPVNTLYSETARSDDLDKLMEDQPEATPLVNDRLPQEPEPRVVEIPLDITALATSALMDEVIKRATSALKQIVVDVFSSPEVRKALTVNVAVNLNTVQKPAAPVAPPDITVPEPKAATPTEPEERRQVEDRRAPEAEKPKKKRILIAGLLNAQQREIANEFGDAVDVRFWKTDDSINTLKSRAGMADVTILVQDFLGGSHIKAVENSGVKFYRHNGGMTKLKDVITGIYVEDPQVMQRITTTSR